MKENEDGAFLSLARAVGVDRPYDWQLQAFRSLVAGAVPDSIVVPTAAGKTMTIVAFVAALAAQAASDGRVTLPRRLVHFVNRRILVDQSTRLAQTLADALEADESLSESGPLPRMAVLAEDLPVTGRYPLEADCIRSSRAGQETASNPEETIAHRKWSPNSCRSAPFWRQPISRLSAAVQRVCRWSWPRTPA